jgi:hypothetical protein
VNTHTNDATVLSFNCCRAVASQKGKDKIVFPQFVASVHMALEFTITATQTRILLHAALLVTLRQNMPGVIERVG